MKIGSLPSNPAIPYWEMKKTGKDLLINLKSNLRVDICAF
jgi:hypothetical protein